MNSLVRIWNDNEPVTVLTAGGIALGFLIAIYIFKKVILKKIAKITAKTATKWDDGVVHAARSTSLLLMLFPAVLIGMQSLEVTEKLHHLIKNLAMGALFLQAGLWISRLLGFVIQESGKQAMESNPATATTLRALNLLGQIVLWVLIFLMMLDNFGVNVTTMIAGLGVGGIAIALAVQNILGDLLASLSIVIDKPFVLGDFIIIDDYMGTVENIGIKTTRIRSLGGEQIIFANNDLLKSRVRNYKRMYERRVLFGFGVPYQTSVNEVEIIPGIVKKIIEDQQKIRFERAHFSKLGNSSLDFEVVYWVLDADYNLYMDIQQSINLALMRAFEERNIVFAYPTRTLELSQPLEVKGLERFVNQSDNHKEENNVADKNVKPA